MRKNMVTNYIVATASEDFFLLYEGNLINFAYHETNWVVDSDASIHATSRK